MTGNTEPEDEPEEEVEFEDLPEAAFTRQEPPCEFDENWVRQASRQQRVAAMRGWFGSRFCDPAEDTPYNGREGGFLFIHGGPYDPAFELDRFRTPLGSRSASPRSGFRSKKHFLRFLKIQPDRRSRRL
jgi:hypothetical protein